MVFLFLNPQHGEDLKKIRQLNVVEGVHIKTVIFEKKVHFLYYVDAFDNVHNHIVATICSIV